MLEHCLLLLLFQDISILDEGDLPDDQENLMFQRVVRQISNRIGELEDYLQQLFLKRPQNQQPQVDQPEDERKNEKKKTKKCMRALEYNSSDNNLTDNQEFRHASSTVVREITTRLEDHKKEIKQDLNGMKKLILKLMKAVAKEPEAEVSGKGETDDNQDNDYEGDGNEDSECSSSQTVEISQKKSLIRRRSEKPKQGTPRKQSKQESPGRKKKEDKPKWYLRKCLSV